MTAQMTEADNKLISETLFEQLSSRDPGLV